MLGWPQDVDDDGDVVLHAPPGAGPNWIFLAVPDEKVVKNRIHFDFRPDDQQAEVDRVIGLGARHVDIGQRATRAGSCWPIRRATNSASSPQTTDRMRTLAPALVLSLAACGSPQPEPPPSSRPTRRPEHRAGSRRHDRWMASRRSDGSPFELSNPIVGWLDPPLLNAIQDAARQAATEGIDIRITSGWRSRGFQQRLLDDAVGAYGSVEAARQFVASPDISKHVEGKAVDIAPVEADRWLIANGSKFGLCQIYANELWHFELAVDSQGRCPPLKPNAAG